MAALIAPSSTDLSSTDQCAQGAQGAQEFDTMAELLRSLGDVPLSRVVWNPRPGTATEEHLLLLVERDKRLCELVDGTLVEKPIRR